MVFKVNLAAAFLWQGRCQVFKNIVKCFTCDASIVLEFLTLFELKVVISHELAFKFLNLLKCCTSFYSDVVYFHDKTAFKNLAFSTWRT